MIVNIQRSSNKVLIQQHYSAIQDNNTFNQIKIKSNKRLLLAVKIFCKCFPMIEKLRMIDNSKWNKKIGKNKTR